MECGYYARGECSSCTRIREPYAQQLQAKDSASYSALAAYADAETLWLPPVASPQTGFRNKAKMSIGGTAANPTLGLAPLDAPPTDLRNCPLYPPAITNALHQIAQFITLANLHPYQVATRTGELKHVLVTANPQGELLIRFVLRSTESLARIRKHLPQLQQWLPAMRVATVNLLPEHQAALEGREEIPLTENQTLQMSIGAHTLGLLPRSFCQTNTQVAGQLYLQAQTWINEANPRGVWDLYCGVGGFALHAAAPGRWVTGVEVSQAAVESAQATASGLGFVRQGPDAVRFVSADATSYAAEASQRPDLIIVNPPRRGIGPELAATINASGARDVIYSSCNLESLAKDLGYLARCRLVAAQVLDMFPHTGHFEVLTWLRLTD